MITITHPDGSTWTMREDMLERVLAAWPAAITPAADDSPPAAVRHLRAVEAETQPDVVDAVAGLGS